jgi:ChrB-like protein
MDMTAHWLLLMYVLPAKHARARVQAWRRLQRVGAVSLKNSAYALPCSAEAREDFEWIKNEIVAIGGQAMTLLADAPDGPTRDEIVGAFRSSRAR